MAHTDVPSARGTETQSSDDGERTAGRLATDSDGATAAGPVAIRQDVLPELPIIARERYVIDGEHGRGGLGRVLDGHDVRLDRPVAIKELLDPASGSQLRFVREAMVTARLQHPSIVPIYEAGRWPTGEPFYAMKMVTGRSLADVIDECPTLDERLALIPNVVAAADALAYAHSQGVVHRDIKPANVLVGSFGETVVIDWGLAKDVAAADDPTDAADVIEYDPVTFPLTRTGAILGTPGYMAPEQAAGRPVDERADVYSMGALLYHVLAGRRPYEGDRAHMEVLAGPPVPLERRQAGVPLELLAIVHKAMAHEPGARYPSARELAEDLRRFQTGQLVGAHVYSRPQLAWRFMRRHRWQALLGLMLLVALGAGYERALSERKHAERERVAAEARTNELILLQARNALASDPTATLAWLKKYPASGTNWTEVRNLAVEARDLGVARHVFVRDQVLASQGDFSSDGRRFVGAGADRTVRVWDTETGRTLAMQPHVGDVSVARFFDGGRRVVIADWNRSAIELWDWQKGTVRTLTENKATANAVAVSSDDRWLAAAGEDSLIHLWDLRGATHRGLSGPVGQVTDVSFSPRDGSLVSVSTDGATWRWDPATGEGKILHRSEPGGAAARHSPDGRWLAVGGADKRIWLYDTVTETGRPLLKADEPVLALVFSHDGQRLAASFRDGSIRLCELSTGTSRVLREHVGEVYSLAFSYDDRELASAGQDKTIRRFHLDTGTTTVLQGHQAEIYQVAYAPGSHLLASTANDHTTRLWALERERGRRLIGHSDSLQAVAFSPDGRHLATASRDATVRVWDRDGRPGPILHGHNGLVWKVAFSSDGSRVLSGGFDGTLRVWDPTSGIGKPLGEHAGPVRDLAFLGPRQEFISIGADRTVRFWLLDSGTVEVLSHKADESGALAVSPDGRLIAWAEADNTAVVLERSSRERRKFPSGDSAAYRLAFSPDGWRLAVVNRYGAMTLWELRTGAHKAVHRHSGLVHSLVFSPDGRWLASAGEDKVIRLGPSDGGPGQLLKGHEGVIRRLGFSPNGQHLASASWDGTVRLWDTSTGSLERIFRHQGSVIGLAFSPDGTLVGSASSDNTAGLWPLDRTGELAQGPVPLQQWMATTTSVTLDAENQPRTSELADSAAISTMPHRPR